MFFRCTFSLILSVGLSVGFPAYADSDAQAVKVVQLFTSHGCSSCPAADELLGQMMAADPELIALEYHVDYWNQLVHGSDGNFVDPFSTPDHTARQREYSLAGLDGRPGVYTPQAIVNGRYAAVGSDQRRIKKALARNTPSEVEVRIDDAGDAEDLATFAIEVDAGDDAGPLIDGAELRLITFTDKTSTHVIGGENRHRTLINHHVVTADEKLATLQAGRAGVLTLTASRPGEGEGCVILVQHDRSSPVLGAAACP